MAILPKSRKAASCSLCGNLKKERRYYLVKPNLFLLPWGNENYIFPNAWRKLITKFKSFSSLYIPHNLIHKFNPSSAPKRGAFIAPPPTLIFHHLFANYFHSINLRVFHCERGWRKKQEHQERQGFNLRVLFALVLCSNCFHSNLCF